MDKIINYILILAFIAGCKTAGTENFDDSFRTQQRTMISKTCFEVVVKKSTEDSLIYERLLPWDLVPFNIRSDAYYSIGTAFSISQDELLTAFHVLNLGENSRIYKDYFIRDSDGSVYPIDEITSFSQAKDYVKFKVQGIKFDKWLRLETNYILNETVYSAGNAYGEGIIVRKGSLIGTIPENENGEWVYIRSSSDVNSGNSGGPLINSDGNAIGIIVMKKDNIAYSLPIGETLNIPDKKGYFHLKISYGFGLIPEKTEAEDLNFELDLPMNYKDIKEYSEKKLISYSNSKMNQLFEENKDEIFPYGESSLEALYNYSSSIMPQIFFKNKSDMTWNISSLKTETSKLKNNGVLSYGGVVGNSMLLYIEKPDYISLKQLNSDSKLVMDLILEGINFPRKIANEEVRIKSLGSPYQVSKVKDIYNRTWIQSNWIIEFSDSYVITYTLPTPEGCIILLQSGQTSMLNISMFDYRKMLDFVDISYYGKLKEWKEYLALKDIIPDNLSSIELSEVDSSIILKSKTLNITSDKSIIDGDDDTNITINYDVYPKNGKPTWDIRRVVLSENKSDNFLIISKNLKPDKRLREMYHDEWNNTLALRHPFNGIPFNDNGQTSIGKLINYKKGDKEPNLIYSLFIAKEGRVDDNNMLESLNKIDVLIKE